MSKQELLQFAKQMIPGVNYCTEPLTKRDKEIDSETMTQIKDYSDDLFNHHGIKIVTVFDGMVRRIDN